MSKIILIFSICSLVFAHTQPEAPEPSNACVMCNLLVTEMSKLNVHNTTTSHSNLLVSACQQAPPVVQNDCHQFVEAHNPILLDSLKHKVPLSQVCPFAKVCGEETIMLVKPVMLPKGEECVICEWIATILETELTANSTEAEIVHTVETICDILPKTIEEQCRQFVETYGQEFISTMVNRENPLVLCTQLQLCQTALAVTVARVEWDPARNITDARLQCGLCALIFSELQGAVSSALASNLTAPEFQQTVTQHCASLPHPSAAECAHFMATHSATIQHTFGTNTTHPDQACTALHLCTLETSLLSNNLE